MLKKNLKFFFFFYLLKKIFNKKLNKIIFQFIKNFIKHTRTKMPPKIDPTELKILKIKTVGGEAGAASSLAPKLGPLGLNAKKVGEDLAKETAKWKGIKVMVEMKVQNRAATLSVIPSAAPLLIKELGEKERDRKKDQKY